MPVVGAARIAAVPDWTTVSLHLSHLIPAEGTSPNFPRCQTSNLLSVRKWKVRESFSFFKNRWMGFFFKNRWMGKFGACHWMFIPSMLEGNRDEVPVTKVLQLLSTVPCGTFKRQIFLLKYLSTERRNLNHCFHQGEAF